MLKIIIPLAGSSNLFFNAGYIYPKPLTEICGQLMIELVTNGLSMISMPFQYIFIVSEEDANKFHLDSTLKLLHPNSIIVKLKKDTKGALCSVLMSIDYINSDDSLLILNGDQIINFDHNIIFKAWEGNNVDGGLVIFKSVHPRWSYALIENDLVIQTAEKNPISNNAIAGYYYFKNAKTFFELSFNNIINDVNLDGMYYLSPVINQYILNNKIVKYFEIGSDKYHSFYSPQLVLDYERKFKKQENDGEI